jgi:hypothetical protein
MNINRDLVNESQLEHYYAEGKASGDLDEVDDPHPIAIDEIIDNELIIDFISAQGPLFESLTLNDKVLSFQLHVVKCQQTYHSELVDVRDIRKPVVFNYSVKARDEMYDPLMLDKPRPSILIYITCSDHADAPLRGKDGPIKHRSLIAQATVDYSIQQLFAGDFISVELTPCLVDYIYATGDAPCSLFVRFRAPEVIPMDSPKRQILENSMKVYQRTITTVGRDVLQQLKAWWAKLRSDFPFIAERQLKFITEDECGRHRFVGSFISAVLPEREINGPRYAARFVSLVPFQREVSLSGGRINRWHSPFATLCRLRGDVEDHAILLCSLLLGWGLQAFVAMGTLHTEKDEKQLHCWVVTICETGRVSFWESLTAEVVDVNSPSMRDLHYREIWSLFRQNEYFVNIQLDCASSSTSFDINNAKYWRSFHLPAEAVTILSHPGASFSLQDSGSLQTAVLREESLERELMDWLRAERQHSGLQTIFDKTLSLALHPTLASYELDRATGSSFGNGEFQSTIRGLVHRGECFKAYPTCFNHTDAQSIQHALLKTKAARDIIYAKSQGLGGGKSAPYVPHPARFGIRVRVFPYPRGLCAVWVVIATCYQGKEEVKA